MKDPMIRNGTTNGIERDQSGAGRVDGLIGQT